MTRTMLISFAESFFSKCIETMKSKSTDYGGGAGPFGNFEAVEKIGITTVEVGFLTRMMDKMVRISNITRTGQTDVLDESVKDTLLDLANYSMLLAAYLDHKQSIKER